MSAPLESLDRRGFLRLVGLGLTSSLAVPAAAVAQSAAGGAAKADSSSSSAKPAPAAPAAPSGPPEISEDARSLAEILRRRYGKHLTPDQLEAVTRELDQRVQGGRRLKDQKLANGDEPDFTFGV